MASPGCSHQKPVVLGSSSIEVASQRASSMGTSKDSRLVIALLRIPRRQSQCPAPTRLRSWLPRVVIIPVIAVAVRDSSDHLRPISTLDNGYEDSKIRMLTPQAHPGASIMLSSISPSVVRVALPNVDTFGEESNRDCIKDRRQQHLCQEGQHSEGFLSVSFAS